MDEVLKTLLLVGWIYIILSMQNDISKLGDRVWDLEHRKPASAGK